MEIKGIKYDTLYSFYLAVFVVITIVLPKAVGIGIVPLILLLVFGLIKNKLVFRINPLSIGFLLFYLAYFIGTFYTNNTDIASKYLEYKLSFIIFPIFFIFPLKNGTTSIPKVVAGLIIGVTIVGVYGVINSILCYNNGGESCFLTVKISPVHHPTYLMSFMIFAMTGSWLGLVRKWKNYRMIWVVPFSLFVIILHYYTLSLAGMLFLLLFFAAFILYYVYKKYGIVIAFGTFFGVFIIGYLAISYVGRLNSEYESAKWYAAEYFKDPGLFIASRSKGMSGSEQRLVMWTVACQEFYETPLGVGTGNVDDTLGERLIVLGQDELAEKQLNPHNQYLQTGVEIGVFGLLIFMLIIGYGIYYGIKNRNWLLLILVSNLAFNSLFESMLQRQSGIVFFTFWMCLLITANSKSFKSDKTK